MADNDINNEEQYKIAANKINDYYKNNKLLVENIYKKENKNSSFEDIEDKGKVMRIYKSFKSSYSLEELQRYSDEDILNKYIFTKGSKDNLCYKLEFAIKVGGIGQSTVFSKYGLCKNETGWHLGSSSKNSESINKERAVKEGKKQIEFIVKGGRVIEKYIKDNKLNKIANYDELDSELRQETSEFSTKPWVRKYYHLLFPEYFCNWFSDNKLSEVLTKLGIAKQSKTYYGKCGQLMKIYKNTGLDNPVLVMFICVALLDIKKEENDDNDNVRYWLYSPGNDAEDWEEHYKKGIMAIGKDAIGNLAVFKSKEEMKQKMQETLKPQKNYTKSANMSWQFVHVMKPGDIVFAKKGRKTIIGRGIVSGNYKFDVNRKHHKNIRYIHWTHKKNYDFSEELFSMNTLINISKIELINKIESLFKDDNVSNSKNPNNSNDSISFPLNQILYGPPGTGKTYNTVIEALRIVEPELIKEYENKEKTYDDLKVEFNRLKGEGQIEFITFHQSYAYEEFVEGIKPDLGEVWGKSTDRLTYKGSDGIFKIICKEASRNKDKKYVLIIDEINRGNISKIFGELITLIEEDKRESFSVRLPYSHDDFTVPKNLYIIGTMNTSDRSIASIDIALRRRFTFKEMMPDSKLVPEKVENIEFKEIFENLNKRITLLLDRDHQIGHSYFMNIKNIDDLKKVWFNSIMPLLNEYFYNDWEKLKLIIPGFIKSIDIPQNLKDECESAYEFKSFDEMKDDTVFIEALNQIDFKE